MRKKCNSCGEDKPLVDFHLRSHTLKSGEKTYYRRHICKACHSIQVLERKNRSPEKQEYHRKVAFKSHLKRTYGLDLDSYMELCIAQDYRCDICGKDSHSTYDKKGGLYVDHCHKSGKIRGLLCHSCNAAIGHLQEDIEILESAIKYLEKHQ